MSICDATPMLHRYGETEVLSQHVIIFKRWPKFSYRRKRTCSFPLPRGHPYYSSSVSSFVQFYTPASNFKSIFNAALKAYEEFDHRKASALQYRFSVIPKCYGTGQFGASTRSVVLLKIPSTSVHQHLSTPSPAVFLHFSTFV